MPEKFTWRSSGNPNGSFDFSVSTAKFGDGYEQSAANGINNEKQTWPLTFVGRKADIFVIRDFLRSHKGYKSFLWDAPFGEEILVKGKQLSTIPNGGDMWTLTVTFEQTFQP